MMIYLFGLNLYFTGATIEHLRNKYGWGTALWAITPYSITGAVIKVAGGF